MFERESSRTRATSKQRNDADPGTASHCKQRKGRHLLPLGGLYTSCPFFFLNKSLPRSYFLASSASGPSGFSFFLCRCLVSFVWGSGALSPSTANRNRQSDRPTRQTTLRTRLRLKATDSRMLPGPTTRTTKQPPSGPAWSSTKRCAKRKPIPQAARGISRP